jgi:hypothetical protein
VRTILLSAISAEDAAIELSRVHRRYLRKAEALDGTLDAKRDKKRRRLEASRGSKFVDTEAGEGEEEGPEEEDAAVDEE